MNRYAVRLFLALFSPSLAYAEDPIGIVTKVAGEWTLAGQRVRAGAHVLPNQSFEASGTGPFELKLIRYSDGTVQNKTCAEHCFYRLEEAGLKISGTGPGAHLADYIKGGAKLPVVYAQSRSFTLSDAEILSEFSILSSAGNTVDFAPVFRKPARVGLRLLVQSSDGPSVATIIPAVTTRTHLPGNGQGVYVLRILDADDGIVASAIVMLPPAASYDKAVQRMADAQKTIGDWDRQSPMDPEARLTLLLNAALGIYSRL